MIGGGNAALSAAITARQAGASVLLLEHAPRPMRGGNSRHTRNLRALHPAPTDVQIENYLEDEYWDDLLRVTGGRTDEALARMTIRASQHAPGFLRDCGVVFPAVPVGHAVAVAHQRLLPWRRQGVAERDVPHRGADWRRSPVRRRSSAHRVDRGPCDGGDHLLSRLSGSRAFQDHHRRLRRIPGEPQLAARILGRCGGQFPDPRDDLCAGAGPEGSAGPGRAAGRRSDAVPCRRERRACADGGWRPRHAPGLHSIRHRRQSRCRAIL